MNLLDNIFSVKYLNYLEYWTTQISVSIIDISN
jgi:hypothetical protein